MVSRRLVRAIAALALAIGLVFSVGVARAGGEPEGKAAGALALEGRLVAPCCWIQTLDVHESELASSLRAEIDTRLRRGEPSEVIEDDLARRYGEQIRGVPKGKDSRNGVPVIAGGAMAVSMVGLVFALRAWRRRDRARGLAGEVAAPAAARDTYDDRLDDELAQLDDVAP